MEAKTLQNAVEEYLKHLEALGKSKSTRYTVKLDLGLLMQHLGPDKELAKLLPVHVAGFFKSELATKVRGRARSKATMLQIRRITRQFLVWAHEQGYIERIPLPKDEMEFVRKAREKTAEQSRPDEPADEPNTQEQAEEAHPEA